MLEVIINKFCNNSKFINDFDGIFKYLDDSNLSYEEKSDVLEEIFSYNSEMYSLILEENKKLEKIVTRINTTKERKEIPVIENTVSNNNEKIEPLKIDVSNYLMRVKNCDKLEELKSVISTKTTINSTIILKLVEDMFDIKKMLYQERNNIDAETKRYFENEAEKLRIKIEYIKQITNKIQTNIDDIKVDNGNELVFLKTNYGNVCLYSDLKDIPVDYYDTFYGLLESICSGNFKNLKVLTGDGPLAGVSEVKDNQARVVFNPVGKNMYIILAMFIKKVNTDAGYRAYVINRKDLFEENKNIILDSINNLEYLEENRQIKNKIYSILNKEDKVKKRGEIND